ncbi:MAG TPA: rhomboid family intramembrane serine protease [Candidatus Angelobacter sp.]|nr:rhomboid family intramembrane serine protease [Candidatus Angelobacter sp.]
MNEDGGAPVLCDRCAGAATGRARRTMSTGTLRDYPATTALIAINLTVFVGMVATGAGFLDFDPRAALKWGGNYGPLTLSGEYWRLITAGFVHGGLFHLLVNMWCLFSLGQLSERLFGKLQTFFIYLLTGVGGALLSIAHDPRHLEVGASGAVFGIAGALLAGVKFGNLAISAGEKRALTSSMVFFIGVNFLLGSGVTALGANVDNMCHLGGFITGALIGLPMGGFAQRHKAFQWATLLVTAVLLTVGYQELRNKYGIPEQLKQAQLALDRRDYQGAITFLEQYTRKDPNDERIWNTLGALYAETGQKDKAIAAFQRSLTVNPNSQAAKHALAQLKEEDTPQK